MSDGTRHGGTPDEGGAWWSRPAEGFAAPPQGGAAPAPWPTSYDAPRGAPAYSAGADLEPVYGAPVPSAQATAEPAAPAWDAGALGREELPWERSGARAWGYPTDTLGRPAEEVSAAERRRKRLGLAAGVLAMSLLGGGVGAAAYDALDDDNLDPSASLGTGVSSGTVDRAPDSVAGIADRVLRSTVSIEVVQSSGEGGSGSGVVLRADGYVLTNNHVVEAGADGAEITVTVNGGSGEQLPAEIVGLDPETDLAVLKVDGAALEPATLGVSADLVVGDPVIAIGSPLGLNGTVTTGIISALNRTVNVPGDGVRPATPLLNAIQTDAAINPGNSGGALVDARGAVIGINSAIATLGGSSTDSGGSIGVGFAIPVDEARSVAEEIIRTGKATHPAIGVEAGNQVGPDGAREGARLTRIVAGGPAGDAGLQVGDVVNEVGDTEVGSVDELILALRQSRVGDTVEIGFVRDGRQQTVSVVLADKAAD